jgi:hypothetical protein
MAITPFEFPKPVMDGTPVPGATGTTGLVLVAAGSVGAGGIAGAPPAWPATLAAPGLAAGATMLTMGLANAAAGTANAAAVPMAPAAAIFAVVPDGILANSPIVRVGSRCRPAFIRCCGARRCAGESLFVLLIVLAPFS